MDESFELMSSMSPKVKGRQKTVKIKNASKLALKKHFRRSSKFDKVFSTRNEDLAIAEVNTESSGSITSSQGVPQVNPKNDVVIIDSSDDEDNNAPNNRIQQWLDNVEEHKTSATFFSQVSTILGDKAPNCDNDGVHIAANSSSNSYLSYRFDELFINKKTDVGDKDLTDDSFSLGLETSLMSRLTKNKEVIVIDETLLTSDESPLKPSPKKFVSARKKPGIVSEISNTPTTPSVQEVESILDSLYGDKWRENRDSVLRPMSESKKKTENTTNNRIVKPSIKKNLSTPKLNFNKLKKPVESPWVQRLKGLVDSDSENDALESKVKVRLDFGESSDKENVPERKMSKSSSTSDDDDVSTDEEYDKEIKKLEIKRKSIAPPKVKVYTFLESLSGSTPLNKCDMLARTFRTKFKQHREELCKKLFTLYNEKVFNNAIPSDTELEWNDKLRKTAGLCYCRKITRRSGLVERKARIALSSKVLDSADRLRDTLIHEMCHAVTWIVNQVSDGHGDYWKSWAFKAMEVFPELPPISRCHSYAINSKYTYKCTKCHYSFGRHSKSLDVERKRCGHCMGKFELLLNKTTKNGETKSVAVTPRKPATGFALFVKENYALYKDPAKKHGDVMKVLGQKFAELKVKNPL